MERKNNNQQGQTEDGQPKKPSGGFIAAHVGKFAGKRPKRVLGIMAALASLSLCLTVFQYLRIGRSARERPNADNIMKGAKNSLIQPFDAAKNVMEMKGIMEELKYYEQKADLTKEDSTRIWYLINKSKKYGNEQKDKP